MRKSTNYGLKLMEGNDNVKRQDFVDNFEIIDREMKSNNTSLKDIANDSYPIVEATGTNSYVGSTARIKAVGKGTRCTLFVGTASNGNCSLNLNNSGAVAIKDSNGNVVTNMKANIPYNLFHNGSDFILQGKGGGGNLISKYLLQGYYGDGDNGRIDGAMVNRGAPTSNLNCGGVVNLQEGYYSGGKVTANSLASQTQANATATQILAGFSAWVNGSKINGNATIESLGGLEYAAGTITLEKGVSDTTVSNFGFKPKYIIAWGYYTQSDTVNCIFNLIVDGYKSIVERGAYGRTYSKSYPYEPSYNNFTITSYNTPLEGNSLIGVKLNWIAIK